MDRTLKVDGNSECRNAHGVDSDFYNVYFGLGHGLKLIDNAKVFRVSPAGAAFGSLLVRHFQRESSSQRFLDVGAGSGVHALLLRSMGVSAVTATDVSDVAVAVAKKNEMNNFGVNVIDFVVGDLFEGLRSRESRYDVVMFNPPGWGTPSQSFIEELKAQGDQEGLSVDSMFYGDRTLKTFFEKLPCHLVDGGKVVIGLNSMVGVKSVIDFVKGLYSDEYKVQFTLLECHEFPLILYTKSWARMRARLVEEALRWRDDGEAYFNYSAKGEITWFYEIVELTLLKR